MSGRDRSLTQAGDDPRAVVVDPREAPARTALVVQARDGFVSCLSAAAGEAGEVHRAGPAHRSGCYADSYAP